MYQAPMVSLLTLCLATSALAEPIYNFSFKFKTPGGDGFVASYFTRTDKQILYSNVGAAQFAPGKADFASIKMPLKGGQGCSKKVPNSYVGNDGANYTNINSTCVVIQKEDDNTYYIKETTSTELDTGAIVHNYVAFHLFINGDNCNTTADVIWRTFKNSGDLHVPATSVEKTCQQAKF